jgi:hypothetical protein
MKDFIVLGPSVSVQYKCVFELLKEGIVNCGHRTISNIIKTDTETGERNVSIVWLTTFPVERTKKIHPVEFDRTRYSTYDSSNVLNVDRIKDIPDYEGPMGVPVTIFGWDYSNYEILELLTSPNVNINGISKWKRVLIKKK